MSSAAPPFIGACRACLGRPRRLDPALGVCIDCLSRHPRRWLALCIRAREDETFRASVRAYLAPGARKLFDAVFGPVVQAVPSSDDAAKER